MGASWLPLIIITGMPASASFFRPLLKTTRGFIFGLTWWKTSPAWTTASGRSWIILLYGLVEAGVYHLLYSVLAVLVQAAVAGEPQVRIRQMNYLQALLSPLCSTPLRSIPLRCSFFCYSLCCSPLPSSIHKGLESSSSYKALVLFFFIQTAQVILVPVDSGRHRERYPEGGDHGLALLEGLDLYIH